MSVAPADTDRLAEVITDAVERVPFYRAHLHGVDARRFDAVPSFDKHATSGFGRMPLSAGGAVGAARVFATSGTTGGRIFVAAGRADLERAGTWLAHVAATVGLGPSDVLLNAHGYGLCVGGPVLDLLAGRAGACVVPFGSGNPAGVLEWMRDGIGTAVCGTPSALRRLVEAAGADLPETRMRWAFVGAEPAEPALRRRVTACFPPGFRWVELYGLTETQGPTVAFGPDPDVPELVLNTRDYLVEVLDRAADEPVGAGEVGELTLTRRHPGSHSPLIRYRTRDLVRVTAGPAEAPTRVSRILGRTDESVKVDGVLAYPSALAEIVSEVLGPDAEWRGEALRNGPDHALVVRAEASAQACGALRAAFAERIGLTASVVPVAAGELPRSHEKTPRIVVREVDDATWEAVRPSGDRAC